MFGSINNTARGAGLSLMAFGVFSLHDAVVKVLGGSFAPFQVVFFSVLFGFPIVTVMLMRDTTDGNLRPRRPYWTAARTVAQVITTLCVFYAFSSLPMAQTYAILFASPLLITVLAIPLLGEKVGWHRGLAVLVGLLGVIIVLQPGGTELTLGHAAALMAAVSSALASVITRKVGRTERNAVLLLYPMVANFVVMGALMPFFYVPMEIQHVGGIFTMAALAFCATLLQISAYRTADAVVVAPMQYSQIIWAVVLGYFFFAESVSLATVLGASVVIASGVYIVMREEALPNSGTPVLQTRSRFAQGAMPRTGTIAGIMRGARDKAKVGA